MATVSATKKEFTAHGKQLVQAAIKQLADDKARFWQTIADIVYVSEEATFEDVGKMLGMSKNTAQKYASPYKR